MFQLSEFFKAIPRVLVMIALVAAGLVALFVAWWIALALTLGFALYIAVWRLLSPKTPPQSRGGSTTIEGEFRVEREDAPPHLRDRSRS